MVAAVAHHRDEEQQVLEVLRGVRPKEAIVSPTKECKLQCWLTSGQPTNPLANPTHQQTEFS